MSPPNTTKSGPNGLPEVLLRQYRHYFETAAPAPSPFSGRVHVYARVSTPDQAEDNKTSLDQQVRDCLEAMASEGVAKPAGIWRDEGYTGFSRLADRPVGKAMLAALRPGDTICVHSVDRFSRQMLGGIADINELRCREIGIYFSETGEFVPPGSGTWDNNKELNFHIRMVMAHNERALIGARVARARQELLERGYWPFGTAPYGYRLEADATGNKRLVEDASEQIVIKAAVRDFRNLGRIRAVVRELNKAGFRNRCGRPFKDYSVWRILQVHAGLTQKRLPGQPRRPRNSTNSHGNPRIGEAAGDAVEAVLQQKSRDAERVKPFILYLVQQQGCNSYGRVADALNFHGVPAPRDGSWYPTSVKNCLAALGFTLPELINLGQSPSVSSQTDELLGPGLQRPSRSERQRIRERYGLPPNPRGKVQRLLPDIIAFRDQKATVPEIARVCGISEVSVKAVIKKYPAPLGRSAERKLTNQIVAAYAKGQPAGAIAKRFGITVPGVMHRLREARKPLEKTTRNVPAPEWLAAVNKRRCVELGQDVMVMKGVPPEVVAALEAWHGGRRKVRGKAIEPVKIIQVAALTAQGLPRDEIAKQLGLGLSTVYRVLDHLRKHLPNSGTLPINGLDEGEWTEARA